MDRESVRLSLAPAGRHPYDGHTASLATMHSKAHAIAPAMLKHCGLRIETPAGIDTDLLGTFTGETPRPGTMLETAIAKARMGIGVTRLSLGLASEGTFGPHPTIPFLPGATELMVLVDDELGIVIRETLVTADTNFAWTTAETVDTALEEFLDRVHFPGHAVVVRANACPSGADASIFKGIRRPEELAQAIRTAACNSTDGRAQIETDMRAFANPTRMAVLAELAERLARRIASICSACGAPGYGQTGLIHGLPCEICGTLTTMVRAEWHGCASCNHSEERPRSDGLTRATADRCPSCNP